MALIHWWPWANSSPSRCLGSHLSQVGLKSSSPNFWTIPSLSHEIMNMNLLERVLSTLWLRDLVNGEHLQTSIMCPALCWRLKMGLSVQSHINYLMRIVLSISPYTYRNWAMEKFSASPKVAHLVHPGSGVWAPRLCSYAWTTLPLKYNTEQWEQEIIITEDSLKTTAQWEQRHNMF